MKYRSRTFIILLINIQILETFSKFQLITSNLNNTDISDYASTTTQISGLGWEHSSDGTGYATFEQVRLNYQNKFVLGPEKDYFRLQVSSSDIGIHFFAINVNMVLYQAYAWDDTDEVIVKINIGNNVHEVYKRDGNIQYTQDFICGNMDNVLVEEFKYSANIAKPSVTLNYNNGEDLEINIQAKVDESKEIEALYISDVIISGYECHYSCYTCDGPDPNNCLSCFIDTEVSAVNKECIPECKETYEDQAFYQDHKCVIDTTTCTYGRNTDHCEKEIKYCIDYDQTICKECSTGYYLFEGICVEECPFFTNINATPSICQQNNIDPTENIIKSVHDFGLVMKDFSHLDVVNEGWKLKNQENSLHTDTNNNNNYSYTNYGNSKCNNLSIALGLGAYHDNYPDGQSFYKEYNDLPPHYGGNVFIKFYAGDSWDQEKFEILIDGISIYERYTLNQDSQILPSTHYDNIPNCGNSNGDIDRIYEIDWDFTHQGSNLKVEFQWFLDQTTWNEWAGLREYQLILFECDPRCEECNEDGICSKCVEVDNVLSTCDCDENYYLKEQYICIQCSYPCKQCTSDTECLECVGNLDFRNYAPDCYCKEGFYEKDEECFECSGKCATCKDEADNCTQCADSSRENYPDCTCQPGYFENERNFCQLCIPPCISCIDSNICDTCVSQPNRMGPPSCKCEKGYYEDTDTGLCANCNIKCSECDNSSTCTGKVCSHPTRDPENNCECKEGYFSLGLLDFECVNTCDVNTPSMRIKNCQTCDLKTKKCTSCNISQNRSLTNQGTCECSELFEDKEGACVEMENFIDQQTMQSGVQAAGAVTMGVSTGVIFTNPALVIHLLDTLQMIRYIIFMQIDYPVLVLQYFKYFEQFEMSFLPNIVPDNTYVMDAPKGFEFNGLDGFFIRNASQYIILTTAAVVIFIILYIFKAILDKCYPVHSKEEFKNSKPLKLINFVLTSGIDGIKYKVTFTGILGSYLTTTLFGYIQIQSINQQEPVQIATTILCYCLLLIEFVVPIYVFKLCQIIQKDDKQVQSYKKIKQRLFLREKYVEFLEDYKDDGVLQQGFFAVICIKKLAFGMSLVFLNNHPFANLTFFTMIFITSTLFLIFKNPYKNRRHQLRDIASDVCFVLIFLVVYRLHLFHNDREKRTTIAYILVVLCSLILLFEVLSFLFDSFFSIYYAVKGVCQRNKKIKNQLVYKKTLSKEKEGSQQSQNSSNQLSVVVNSEENSNNSNQENNNNNIREINLNNIQNNNNSNDDNISENQNNNNNVGGNRQARRRMNQRSEYVGKSQSSNSSQGSQVFSSKSSKREEAKQYTQEMLSKHNATVNENEDQDDNIVEDIED